MFSTLTATLSKTSTHTDAGPRARLSLSIDQPDLSNSTPCPAWPPPPPSTVRVSLATWEGSSSAQVSPPHPLTTTSVCPARLISLSLCQSGRARGGCQSSDAARRRRRSSRWGPSCRLMALNSGSVISRDGGARRGQAERTRGQQHSHHWGEVQGGGV